MILINVNLIKSINEADMKLDLKIQSTQIWKKWR